MSLVTRNRLTSTLAAFLIWAGGGWLLAGQDGAVPSSYAMFAGLLTVLTVAATALIGVWHGRTGVLLAAPAPAGIRPRPAPREAF